MLRAISGRHHMLRHFLIMGIMLLGQAHVAHAKDKKEHPVNTEIKTPLPSVHKKIELQLLAPNEYEIAKPFFQGWTINQPMLYSMLEHKCAGKIFTNSKRSPSFILICNSAGYVYLGGQPNQASLQAIVTYLKTLPEVFIVCPFNWGFKSFFEKEGFIAAERLQLQRKAHHFDAWMKKLPARYSIQRITKENFAQCDWHSFISSCYGGDDHFLTHAIGFCVVDQGKIISEAYGLLGAHKAEIGVVTDENYRGQNLGAIICAYMLDYCYTHSIEPFWTCYADNPSSAAVAKKLGFQETDKYFYLKWKAS
ncbi:MAG: zmaR [Chlamydiia bacterium]|nr:zmaR [Chlamydiia bacterium]